MAREPYLGVIVVVNFLNPHDEIPGGFDKILQALL